MDEPEWAMTRPLGKGRKCCRAVVWMPEDRLIAVGGDDGHIALFGEDGLHRGIVSQAHRVRILGMALLANGFLVSIPHGNDIHVWDLSREPRMVCSGTVPSGFAASICIVGRFSFVVGSSNGGLFVLSLKKYGGLYLETRFPKAHTARVDTMHSCMESGILATGSKDRSVMLWHTDSMKHFQTLLHHDRVFSVRIGSQRLVAGTLYKVFVYRKANDRFVPHCDVSLRIEVIWTMRFVSSDVVVAGGENELTFIDTNSGTIIRRLRTRGKIIQDAELVRHTDVAVVGAGTGSNAIVRLPQLQPATNSYERSEPNYHEQFGNENRDHDHYNHCNEVEPGEIGEDTGEINYDDGMGLEEGGKQNPSYNNLRSHHQENRSILENEDGRSFVPENANTMSPTRKKAQEQSNTTSNLHNNRLEGNVQVSNATNLGVDRDPRRTRRQVVQDRKVETTMRDEVGEPVRSSHSVQGPHMQDEKFCGVERQDANGNPHIPSADNVTGNRDPRRSRRQVGESKEMAISAHVEKDENNKSARVLKKKDATVKVKEPMRRARQDQALVPGCESETSQPDQSVNMERRTREIRRLVTRTIESAGNRDTGQSMEQANRNKAGLSTFTNATTKTLQTMQVPKVQSDSLDTTTNGINTYENQPPTKRCSGQHKVVVPVSHSSPTSCSIDADPMDGAVAKMAKWGKVGVKRVTVSAMNPPELAEAMAAYMLRYRTQWVNRFSPLKDCLHQFFDEDCLIGEDLVNTKPEDAEQMERKIVAALEDDEKVGAKYGLVRGVARFLRELR